MKLTKNFDRKEFDCKDGTEVPAELIKNVENLAFELQKVRDLIDSPIIINSGYRTEKYNEEVGGSDDSYHKKAMAGDLKPVVISVDDLFDLMLILMRIGYLKKGGLKKYKTFVHYDIRGKIVLF